MSIFAQLPNDIIIKIISNVSRDDLRNHKKNFKNILTDIKTAREKADGIYERSIARGKKTHTWQECFHYYCVELVPIIHTGVVKRRPQAPFKSVIYSQLCANNPNSHNTY